MNNRLFQINKAVLLPLGWIAITGCAGLALGASSPHGMAGFIYASFIQGVFCGAVHLVAYYISAKLQQRSLSPSRGFWLGLVCGALTFPLATLIAEHRIYLPHDLFQFLLIGYLSISGALIGWIINRYFLVSKLEAPQPIQD